MQTRNWRDLERHPLSKAYPDLAAQAWQNFKASVNQGLRDHHVVTIHEGKVLDGWQLQRACVELDVKPKYAQFPKDGDAEAFVEVVNDHRRHETQEKAQERVEERRERVAKRRATGESLRTIAEAEGVAESTVRSDLAMSGAQGCAPDPPDGKTAGKDGKTYPAAKPEVLCPRCQRVGKQEGCEACKEAKVKARKPPTRTRGTKIVTDRDLEPEDKEEDTTVEGVMKRVNHDIEVLARKITALIDEIPKDPWIDKELNLRASIADKLKNAAGALRSAKCTKICPSCRGEGCTSCHRTGRVTQGKYQQLV